jgi:hypothetical protein
VSRSSRKCGSVKVSQTFGLPRSVTGIDLLFFSFTYSVVKQRTRSKLTFSPLNSLKHSGYYTYQLLYHKIPSFLLRNVHMAIPRFSNLTKIISLNKINRSEFLDIINMKFTLQTVSTKLMQTNIFDLRVYLQAIFPRITALILNIVQNHRL